MSESKNVCIHKVIALTSGQACLSRFGHNKLSLEGAIVFHREGGPSVCGGGPKFEFYLPNVTCCGCHSVYTMDIQTPWIIYEGPP